MIRRLDRAGAAMALLLPPALFYSRAGADALMTATGVLFLLRCAAVRDWGWLRALYPPIAAMFWAWLVVCSALAGSAHALMEALAVARYLLFVPALEHWALRPPATRRALAWTVGLLAVWLVAQSWQQYLTGTNLFGAPRFGDGALTGPFVKPRAGGVFLALWFLSVLPASLWLLRAPRLALRAGGVLLLMAAAATMVLIGQRMPTVLLLLGLCAAALVVRRLRWPVLAALGAGAALLALTPLISPPTFAKLAIRFTDQVTHFWVTDYGLLFNRATIMLRAHRWTGLGFDGFRDHCADAEYLHGQAWLGVPDALGAGPGGCNIHPHNYYLDAAVSAGVPGLLLFAALAASWLAPLAQRAAGSAMQTGLFAGALVAVWPIASTSSLWSAETAGWVFLTIGWGLSNHSERAP